MIRVEVIGTGDLMQRIADFGDKQSGKVLKEVAQEVFNRALAGAEKHTKTNALVDSLGPGPRKIPGGYEISHDLQRAKHGLYVHWGTRPHVIKPKEKKVLRWPSGGSFAFAKAVNHPGYKGDPWLVHAVDYVRQNFDAIAARSTKG